MVQVLREIPLSAVTRTIYLAGATIDPASIVYTMRRPDGLIAVDEDGAAVAARRPIRIGEGNYGAGNATLPGSAPLGKYTIEWRVQKTTASPVTILTDEFEVVAEDGVPAEVSQRDLPDTPSIVNLRSRIKDDRSDDRAWAFANSELARFLADAIAIHTEGRRAIETATADDLALAMLLAHCAALRALATDRSRFFRWQDGNEAVDKSMIPRNLLEVAASLMDEYRTVTRRRIDERANGVTDEAPTGGVLEFRRR